MKRLCFALVTLLAAAPLHADEGMWTFDNVPREAIHARYGVTLTDAWLDHLRLSTVRLNGCTGSFISPDGLVITNHHCAESGLVEHSKPGHDLYADGYVARSRAEELPFSGEQVSVLVKMEDVTAQVSQALRGLDETRAQTARKRTLSELEIAREREARKDPALGDVTCEAVTLYQGGQYFIYTYKLYDDVRLVFSPEFAISDFGGDPDNFQYPRWDFDIAMLRVY